MPAQAEPTRAETPTDQYLPPGMPGFRNARIYPLHPSVDRARAARGTGAPDGRPLGAGQQRRPAARGDRQGKPEGDRDRCSDPDSPRRRLLQEAWAERRAVRPRAVTVVRRLRRPRHLPRLLRSPTRPRQPEPIHQCLPLRRAWIHATPGGGRATLTAWPLRRLRPARVGPRAKRRALGSDRQPGLPGLLLAADRLPGLPAALRHRPGGALHPAIAVRTKQALG